MVRECLRKRSKWLQNVVKEYVIRVLVCRSISNSRVHAEHVMYITKYERMIARILRSSDQDHHEDRRCH